MQSNRPSEQSSAMFIFNNCIKSIGCDRNVYHKNPVDGNHARKLVERRHEFGKDLFPAIKACIKISIEERQKILEKDEINMLALGKDDEVKSEIEF